ncbi:hypothetical protein GCM10028775_28690 [Catellatospora paridis]
MADVSAAVWDAGCIPPAPFCPGGVAHPPAPASTTTPNEHRAIHRALVFSISVPSAVDALRPERTNDVRPDRSDASGRVPHVTPPTPHRPAARGSSGGRAGGYVDHPEDRARIGTQAEHDRLVSALS